MSAQGQTSVSAPTLDAIERTAVELAQLSGAEIKAALGGILSVSYKSGADASALWRDPVSEVDHRVEVLIRARLSERFPEHDVIGEEMDERPGRDHDFVWAVDPIDGTTNFVNGFPLFAASIGVLHRNKPIAGAVWCATSHTLRAGVYHARAGGPLSFEGQPVQPRRNPAVRRRLAGVPYDLAASGPWDLRKTGSASIECALVAAGLLETAWFMHPNLWDVAGGVALVQAAGGEVRRRNGKDWEPLESFEPFGEPPDLRNWHGALALGTPEAVDLLCGMQGAS